MINRSTKTKVNKMLQLKSSRKSVNPQIRRIPSWTEVTSQAERLRKSPTTPQTSTNCNKHWNRPKRALPLLISWLTRPPTQNRPFNHTNGNKNKVCKTKSTMPKT